jgi:hypothetical protein
MSRNQNRVGELLIMKKRFNTTGICVPKKHYMVNIDSKIEQIKELIENELLNSAVDFNVDMSFSSEEIATMLEDYCNDNELIMDIEMLSKEVFFYKWVSVFS